MAIKLNEITNFTHKKTAMLSGADFRFWFQASTPMGGNVTTLIS
nr:MAG TPA: hypothetical protein [Bacteriophage sp.]DAN77935.1 MAG TPA: hypothetical protein [Bacteriophage sp.]